MAGRVLVAHASKHGATAEIARVLAETLEQAGLDVELRPAEAVRSVGEYGAVVLGSAVYMGRWRRPAMRLLRRQREALADRDVWLFSSGPVGDADTEAPEAQRWLRPPRVERLAGEIGAHEHRVFGGMVAEDGGPLRKKMARDTPEHLRDLRDWDAIRSWARGIAATVTVRPASPT